jgi:hypothetical protein
MSQIFYIKMYDDDALNKVSIDLKNARISIFKYMGMIVFVFVVGIIALTRKNDPGLNFFFSTSAFVCLVLMIKLSFNLFSNLNMSKSLFQLQVNIRDIESYLFQECNGQRNRALVGVRNPKQICVVTENKNGKFFTAIGNKDSIHKSEIIIKEYEIKKFNFVIENNDFYTINENW